MQATPLQLHHECLSGLAESSISVVPFNRIELPNQAPQALRKSRVVNSGDWSGNENVCGERWEWRFNHGSVEYPWMIIQVKVDRIENRVLIVLGVDPTLLSPGAICHPFS